MTEEFCARVVFIDAARGKIGRLRSGLRVNLILSGRGSVCEVAPLEPDEELTYGKEHDVRLRIPWASEVPGEISPGVRFAFMLGSSVVGRGVFIPCP